MDSFIQKMIDKYGDVTNLKLILCGSYVGIMQDLVSYGKPLYGRLRTKIQLEPFDYFDAANFYSSSGLIEKTEYYAVFGGMPYYLSFIDPTLGFEANVKDLIVSNNAPLESEINLMVKPEISKIANANFLFSLIASGSHKYSDLKDSFNTNFGNNSFDYTLKKPYGTGARLL